MAKKNFLLLSLDDDKTKAIANTVSNPTCIKILDFLSENDGTESLISEKLSIPISTVHYNLKQLVDARLVEIESSSYSKKGKPIKHYTLANKYIIIAPKGADKESFLEAVRNILPVFSFGLLGAYFINMFTNSGVSSFGGVSNNLVANSISAKSMPVLESALVADASEIVSESSQTLMYESVAPNSAGISTTLSDVILSFEAFEWFLFGFVFALFCIWLTRTIKKKFFNKKSGGII